MFRHSCSPDFALWQCSDPPKAKCADCGTTYDIATLPPTTDADYIIPLKLGLGCKSCPLKAKCTRNKENRTITRLASEEVQERMAERVAANPQIMRRRKAIIEHCFGTIKRSLRLRLLPLPWPAQRHHGNKPHCARLQPEAGL